MTSTKFLRLTLLLPLALVFIAWLVSLLGHPYLSAIVSFVVLYCGLPYGVFAVFAWKRLKSMTPGRALRFVALAPLLFTLAELLFLATFSALSGTPIGRFFGNPQPIECWRVPMFIVLPVGYLYILLIFVFWCLAKWAGYIRDEGSIVRIFNRYVVALFSVAGVVTLLFIFSEFARMFMGIALFTGSALEIVETKMKTPAIYEAAADRLILYCQSDPSVMPSRIGPAWLPKEMQELGANGMDIHPGVGFIEFGGGFYHFGYKLALADAPPNPPILVFTTNAPQPAATNVWRLYMMREGTDNLLLKTYRVPSTYRLSADQLLEMAREGYDSILARDPKDDRTRVGKILLYIRFGKLVEAEQACKVWIDSQPDYWLPRFVYAHVRSREGQADVAAAEFNAWVEAHQDFYKDIYLFLFNMRENRNDAALDAIRKAVVQRFDGDEPGGEGANKFYLAYNAAVFAFAKGDYKLCLAMCDKILADSRRGEDYFRRDILKLKAATHVILGDQGSAIEAIKRMPPNGTMPWDNTESEHQTNEMYLAAIKESDLKFLKDYRRWKQEVNDWYTPLQIGERDQREQRRSPSLYPEDWREKVGF